MSAGNDPDLSWLVCPKCEDGLVGLDDGVACEGCGERFPVEDGIPLLYWPNEWEAGRADVTEEVRAFYEETPFPSYEELDDANSLIQKARQGRFAKLLDDQVPAGARVLATSSPSPTARSTPATSVSTHSVSAGSSHGPTGCRRCTSCR